MAMQSTIVHMPPLQCTPALLGFYGGRVSETTFETSPGCSPDPAPGNGDYYQIDPLDGDGVVCGHTISAEDYMVWDSNTGAWYPMSAPGTSTTTKLFGPSFDNWTDFVAYTGYGAGDVVHIRVGSVEPTYHYRAIADTGQPNGGDGGAYVWPTDKATSGLVWEQI